MAGGQVDVSSSDGPFVGAITHILSLGAQHVARIIKSGNQLTFELDAGADGSVDGSTTIAMPSSLNDTNSRIYFGTAGSEFDAGGNWFDDLHISAVPYVTNPETKDDCKKGGFAQYGFRNQGLCIQYVNTGKDSR